MSDLVGRTIGQYEIVGPLGQGGMATVYRARQAVINREVAIKVIKAEHAQAEDFLKRFEREAQTVASLAHPYILKLFDFGQQEGLVFLVTELMTGGSLKDLMRQGPLKLDTTSRLLEQIASALAYAHQQGIVHRDLKPQNVLLDGLGNAYLADFGIAKLMTETTDLTQEGAVVGTPAYLSPERWRGEPADEQSDIYALGVMLFEMLANQLPFAGDTPYSMMHMHLYEPPPFISTLNSGISASIATVVEKSLAKSRFQRYQSATVLAESFKVAASGRDLFIASMPSNSIDDQTTQVTAAALTEKKVALTPEELEAPTITPSLAAEQERRAILQMEAERRDRSKSGVPVVRTTFINALPQDLGDRFKDRSKAQADIVNLLIEKTRLVGIYGRGGIGKTALACKVLGDLQTARDESAPDGMIYMSTTSTGISLDRIFNDFAKLLTGEARDAVEAAQRDSKMSVARKVATLLTTLGSKRYVLLMDNLETLQDPDTGQLTDPDLRAFFEAALEQGSSLRIVVTSRDPLGLPRTLKTWERVIALEEGLPVEDAIELLRTLDPDGLASLRDAPNEQLARVVEHTRGFPRALEAVAGLLLEDPLLSLNDLLEDLSLLTGEVTPVIVQQAISRLNPDALRVMDALALFRRPVSQAALAFLLAPYIDTTNLRTIMARLVRGYFASYNKVTQEFAIHAIDQRYCYNRIPEGQPSDALEASLPFTRNALHHRAADYYKRERKPDDDWNTFDDVAPNLAEYEHLVAAGDYSPAAEILQEITLDNLFVWGFYRLVVNLSESIQTKITDDALKQDTVRFLGIAYANLGQLPKAIACFEQALALSRQLGNRGGEAGALNNLGLQYSEQGKNDRAIENFEQALVIVREVNNRRGEGLVLNNLGLCSAELAQTTRAIDYFEQALVIARDTENRSMESLVLCNLGRVLVDVERYPDALQRLQDSISISREINSPDTINHCQYYIALIALYQDDLATSRKNVEAARLVDNPQTNHDVRVLAGILALRDGNQTAAVDAFRSVTKINESIDNSAQDNAVLFAKSLAWAGVTLSEGGSHLPTALTAFQSARATSSDPGVLARTLHVFDALAKTDSTGLLTPLRAVLTNPKS